MVWAIGRGCPKIFFEMGFNYHIIISIKYVFVVPSSRLLFRFKLNLTMDHSILLRCVKENNILKVKIVNNGYSNKLNCAFPSYLKEEGAVFFIKSREVKLSVNSKYYTVKNKKSLTKIRYWPKETAIHVEEKCVICLTNKACCVLLECGHMCFCMMCF